MPQGDPRLKIEYYSDQMRRSWDLAGAARSKFKAYKRVLRRFCLKSTDSEATRVLLAQVSYLTSKCELPNNNFKSPVHLKDTYLSHRIRGEYYDIKLQEWRLVDRLLNVRNSLEEIEILQNQITELQQTNAQFRRLNDRLLRHDPRDF